VDSATYKLRFGSGANDKGLVGAIQVELIAESNRFFVTVESQASSNFTELASGIIYD